MQEIMSLYHNKFLPLWASSIQLMSSSELTRQNRIAQNYWLCYFRFDKEYKLRLAELESIIDRICFVRHVSRPGANITRWGREHKKRAHEAIASLSELRRAQYQEAAKSHAQAPRDVSPQDRATSSVNKPTTPNARKTTLWQPHRRSTDEELPGTQSQKTASTPVGSFDDTPLQDVATTSVSKPAVPDDRKTVGSGHHLKTECWHARQDMHCAKPNLLPSLHLRRINRINIQLGRRLHAQDLHRVSHELQSQRLAGPTVISGKTTSQFLRSRFPPASHNLRSLCHERTSGTRIGKRA